MGHCEHVALPLAFKVGGRFWSPGLQTCRAWFPAFHYYRIFAVNWAACVRHLPAPLLLGLRGEDRGARPCPRSAPAQTLSDMTWRCRFQPILSDFGGAGVPGQKGTPTQQWTPQQGLSSPLANLSPGQRTWLQHHQPKPGCSPRLVICGHHN